MAEKTTAPQEQPSSIGGQPERKQVFVAYSYKLYPKDDYRMVYRKLEEKYDVTFIFADEKITNMHIMKKIESYIRSSDFSVFDISGWNPNVTLELGFAMAASDQWYIAIDPSKTEINEVPSDLRGLDRIQYHSYTELGSILEVLIEQRYPRKKQGGIDYYLDDKRTELTQILQKNPGLTVTSIAQLFEIEVAVAQIIVRPLFEQGFLESRGIKKSMRYFIKGTVPEDPH